MKLLRTFLLTSSSLLLAAACSAQTAGNRLLITQVYGGSANAAGDFTNDYVEIYNPTSTPIVLTSYTIQYASNSGTSYSTLTLTGTAYPYHYYLAAFKAGGGASSTAITTADATSGSDLSGTHGKITLAATTTANTTQCPGSFVSFVGYGTDANCSESGATSSSAMPPSIVTLYSGATYDAPAPSATTADVRKRDTTTGAYVDAGVNSTDFTATTPNPHNSKFAYAWLLSNDGTANKVNGTGITTGVGANVVTAATPFGSTSLNFGQIAMDASGNAWYVGGNPSSVGVQNATGTRSGSGNISYTINPTNTTTAAVPFDIAVDGLSNLWITDPGQKGIVEMSTSAVTTSTTGAPVTISPPLNGFATAPSVSGGYSSPNTIAIDISGNVWVVDDGAQAVAAGPGGVPAAVAAVSPVVYEIIGAAAPAAPLSTAIATGTTGVRP